MGDTKRLDAKASREKDAAKIIEMVKFHGGVAKVELQKDFWRWGSDRFRGALLLALRSGKLMATKRKVMGRSASWIVALEAPESSPGVLPFST